MDVCLRVLKESNKSRFDSSSVRKSVLIKSHITFRDCRVHIFSDYLSRNRCITAFASISRSTALEIEALSFAVNRLRTVRTQMKCDVENLSPGEILFGIESHVFASEEYECK